MPNYANQTDVLATKALTLSSDLSRGYAISSRCRRKLGSTRRKETRTSKRQSLNAKLRLKSLQTRRAT